MNAGPDLETMSPEQRRELLALLLRERGERPREVRLSPGQRRLWDSQKLEPASPFFNIAISQHLEGPLDAEALAAAVTETLGRHDALRATFPLRDGEPIARIFPRAALPPCRRSSTSRETPRTDRRNEADRLARLDASTPFDLANGPLYRASLLRLGPLSHVLTLTVHHLVCDRWSLGLLSREISALYESRTAGRPAPTPAPSSSYDVFADEERAAASTEARASQLSSWSARMREGGPVPAPLAPTVPPGRHPSEGYRGARHDFTIEAPILDACKALGRAEGVMSSVVPLAAFAELVRRRTSRSDLLIATPVAGRADPRFRGTVGYFNNVLPLRLDLSGSPSFRELIGRVSRETRGAYARQDVPFQDIAALPELSHVPMTRLMFSLQNVPELTLLLPGIVATHRDVTSGTANFDLALFLEEREGILAGMIDHKRGLFDEGQVERLADDYRALLVELTEAPDRSLKAVETVVPDPAAAPSVPSTPVLPGDELRRRLLVLWADALGLPAIGLDDDFLDLGGSSMTAARLFERIGRELGIELPPSVLLHAGSVDRLARLIAERGTAPSWSCLVPVQPEGDRPPLYCVHAGGGSVLSYRRLAALLGGDQPVWGLQAPTLPNDATHPTPSVEDRADRYLEAITSQRPAGPYLIAGHSLGGLIAYEMARKLHARGDAVPLVLIIDQPGPAARIGRRDRLRWHGMALAQLDWRERLTYVRRAVTWRVVSSPRFPNAVKRVLLSYRARGKSPTTRLRNFESSMAALRRYHPQPYPGRITLIRGRQGIPAVTHHPEGGWSGLAAGGVAVHDVPGTHMNMFVHPNVQEMAATVRACLDQALGVS